MIPKPGTLIFRWRVETLRTDLLAAYKNLNKLPSAADEVRRLAAELGTSDLQSLYEDVRRLRTDLQDRRQEAQAKQAQAILDKLSGFEARLLATKAALERHGSRSFLPRIRITAGAAHDKLQTSSLNIFDGLSDAQETALNSELMSNDAWTALSQTMQRAQNAIFNETVELLGGIAIRDARLDDSICDLADSLAAQLGSRARHSLHVIPGGISSMVMTLGRTLRLRFPQWTVWALPLTVHELYYLVMKDDVDAVERLVSAKARVPSTDKQLADLCLADIYATFVIGPAYACAALSLSLDPASGRDHYRAIAILRTMTEVQYPGAEGKRPESLGGAASFAKLSNEFMSAWSAARRQAGVPDEVEGSKEIADLVQELCHHLRRIKVPCFEFALWNGLDLVAPEIEAGRIGGIAIDGWDLRHALNAVWLARLMRHDPLTADLTENARALVARVDEALRSRLPAADPMGSLQ